MYKVYFAQQVVINFSCNQHCSINIGFFNSISTIILIFTNISTNTIGNFMLLVLVLVVSVLVLILVTLIIIMNVSIGINIINIGVCIGSRFLWLFWWFNELSGEIPGKIVRIKPP